MIGYPLVINTSQSEDRDDKTIPNYEQLYCYLKQPFVAAHADLLISESPIKTCIREMTEIAIRLKLPATLPWQLVAHDYYRYDNAGLITADSLMELKQNG